MGVTIGFANRGCLAGVNFARDKGLDLAYDPGNLFHINQNIKPVA